MSDEISVLRGKTMVKVKKVIAKDGCPSWRGESLVFTTDENEVYRLYHEQNCCESVVLEDICGDLQDLVGKPILEADMRENDNHDTCDEFGDSRTWTFYIIATIKGAVTLRWVGQSNGWYSESVHFEKVSK